MLFVCILPSQLACPLTDTHPSQSHAPLVCLNKRLQLNLYLHFVVFSLYCHPPSSHIVEASTVDCFHPDCPAQSSIPSRATSSCLPCRCNPRPGPRHILSYLYPHITFRFSLSAITLLYPHGPDSSESWSFHAFSMIAPDTHVFQDYPIIYPPSRCGHSGFVLSKPCFGSSCCGPVSGAFCWQPRPISLFRIPTAFITKEEDCRRGQACSASSHNRSAIFAS